MVYNTLETHLLKTPQLISPRTNESDDIISLDDSASDIDLVYQHTTTFENIASRNHNDLTNFTKVSNTTPAIILSQQNQL